MSEEPEFQKVCELDDVWEGEMDVFEVGGKEVLIVHAPGGELRAYNPICPHQDHPLVEGELDDCVLTCSAHLWQFNVVSGEGVNPTGVSLVSYPVKTDDDAIWVAVPADTE
ncbi:Rieske 2Fe-2S domain-containing protein [Pseudomonadota bacterium]